MILCFIADGRSIHTRRWVEFFAQRGYTVHLITYDPMGIVIEGVIEHVITSRWKNLYLSFLPRHLAIKKLVNDIRPDLIHAHFIAKYGFHLPSLLFKPAIVSAWGDDILILPKNNLFIWYYTKKVLDSVDLIYTVSQDIKNRIIDDFRIPKEKVKYFPFGIDTSLFSPALDKKQLNRTSVEIFSNRGFFPVYDSETLVRGFALAYQNDRRLHLILKGEGAEEQKIRNLVVSLGISDKVTFREKTDYRDVPNDYRNVDIFITTSLSDGTPVSILEAMSSGLPCIATNVGGIPEWIDHQNTGILIPPRSPEMVADAILNLANDPALRNKLGSAARAVIIARGEWTKLMVQVEKDYEDLVNTYREK
ncbi:MAG: glycosyltransferase family 4 protein [Methanoregulaceae archaeon]